MQYQSAILSFKPPTIVMNASDLNVANTLQVPCMFLRWTLLDSKRYSSITIGFIFEYPDVGDEFGQSVSQKLFATLKVPNNDPDTWNETPREQTD